MSTPAPKLAPVDLYSLKKGDTDYLGNIIQQVYAKEPGKYLIYVTTDHQLICKGEDESVAKHANINKLLLQIGDFISHNRSLKPTYNSSLAYAMKIFFDGDAISSYHSLQNVHSNIKRHLTRRARLAYQAGAASILFLSLAAFLIAVRLVYPINWRLICLWLRFFRRLVAFFLLQLGLRASLLISTIASG